jgi:hypothetical protein
MNLSKFFITGIVVTILALGYVHQQVELLKIGYLINKNNEHLNQLLDVNGILSYNVDKSKFPRNVYSRLLASSDDFEIGYTPRVVKIYPQSPLEQLAAYGKNRSRVDVLAYLGLTNEAEALTSK